jgi:hypothetical protein
MSEREEHRALLEAELAATPPFPAGRFDGRGIVLCAGGDVYFPCAWVCVRMLRRAGCTLPIEIWYRGPREMTTVMIALLEPYGVTCVDAYEVARQQPYRRLDGWEMKPFAIAWSRFAEVLYLDADNVAIRDPEFLFETDAYRGGGAVFWPDRYSGPGTGYEWMRREAWELCGVPYRLEPEVEAGQLLIDKRRCWRALHMTLHLNAHSDFYYAYFYGDKDTFRLAWHRTGTPYALAPTPPRTLGSSEVIVQHDFDGRPLFQHRNGQKWSLTHAARTVAGFEDEAACFGFLAELRESWQPPVRILPQEFSGTEMQVYRDLCATSLFEYGHEGKGSRRIELRSDFAIGEGAAQMEVAWMIEDDKDGAPLLSIRNANTPTCFLRRGDDGAWHGRWLVYDRGRVTLRSA